jgi:hypothetical protein
VGCVSAGSSHLYLSNCESTSSPWQSM